MPGGGGGDSGEAAGGMTYLSIPETEIATGGPYSARNGHSTPMTRFCPGQKGNTVLRFLLAASTGRGIGLIKEEGPPNGVDRQGKART